MSGLLAIRLKRLDTRAWLWLVAAVVSMLHLYPDLRFLQHASDRAGGMHLTGVVDETFYLSRIGAAIRGDRRMGNIAIYEHRRDPYLFPPVPEVIHGWVGRVLGLSLQEVDWLFTLFLPPAAFLLLYGWLGYLGVSSHSIRVVASLYAILGLSWLSLDLETLRTIWREGLPLMLIRPISPQWHFPCWLLALLLSFRCLVIRTRLSALLAGLAGGLVWYTSIYYSSFVLVLLGMLALGAILRRDWNEVGRLTLIVGIIAILAIPFLVNWSHVQLMPASHELPARFGVEHTRQPVFPPALVAATIAVLIGFWPRERRARGWLLACLAAAWLCLNQHLITGWTLQPFHWRSFVAKPIAITGLALTAGLWMTPWPRRRRQVVGGVVIAAILGGSWVIQERYYQVASKKLKPFLALGPVCQWLERQAGDGRDSVVLMNPLRHRQAEFISTYTGYRVYFSEPFFCASLVPLREIEHRYLAALHFYGYTPDEAQALFKVVEPSVLFLGFQTLRWAKTDPAALQRYLAGLAVQYQRRLHQDPVEGLRPYRATYAVLSHDDVARVRSRQPALLERLVPVYHDQQFVLYRLPVVSERRM